MSFEQRQLRRVLVRLRRSQARTYVATKAAGQSIGARLSRAKLETINHAIRDVLHRLRTLGR